jgi:hypothetical protein
MTISKAALNGMRVARRVNNVIYITLPREMWRQITGGCSCQYCSPNQAKVNKKAYWDTLAILRDHYTEDGADTTWTVHAPELHGADSKRMGG